MFVLEGGLLLSQIRLGNEISSRDHARYYGNHANIKGFTLSIFRKMEYEYENNYYMHPYKKRTTEKLANILCNVLVNGNFNPEDKTDYLK